MKKYFIVIVLVLIISLTGCDHDANISSVQSCNPELKEFDNIIQNELYPFTDSDSICYDLHVGEDLYEIEPRYATAMLTDKELAVDKSSYFREGDELILMRFSGNNETTSINIMLNKDEYDNYKVGEFYIVDMINICRSMFMMVDSRYPSPIADTISLPRKPNCK